MSADEQDHKSAGRRGPRELLPPPAHFTDRAPQLVELDEVLSGDSPDRPPLIVALVGAGGVGKSALLLHWLHRHYERFPDGQLYVDMRGLAEGEPLPPSQVLARFLRALGTPPEQVPATLDELSATFRSLTSGRRIAILADDAASAAQVRAILPGRGGNLVAVTSRRAIRGLIADGARLIDVDPLGRTAAVSLLTKLIGRERTLAEPDSTEELARFCGYLPIALRASGIRLAVRHRWPVSRLVGDLAEERHRLSAISAHEEPAETTVRAVFDVSYTSLGDDAALLYRCLGPHPGRDFGPGLAAAAAGISPERAEDALDELVDAHLLEETGPGRLRMHDLVRIHAEETLAEAAGGRRQTTLLRIIDWYLLRAAAADLVINPGRWRIGDHYAAAREEPPPFSGTRAALDWLDAELPNLLAAQKAAADHGAHAPAWQMCEALWGLFQHRKHFTEWIASHERGLDSARSLGDQAAESWIVDHLGFAYRGLGQGDEAERRFTRALTLARSAGHRLAEAMAMEHLGLLDLDRGRPEEATGYFTAALQTHRSLDRPRGAALMLRHIGEAHRAAGRHTDAIRSLAEAQRGFAALADRYQEARSLTSLAEAHIAAGDLDEAQAPLEQALGIMRDEGAPVEQARVHAVWATASEWRGAVAAARDHLERARELLTGVDDRQADLVGARLEALGRAEEPGAHGADE